MDTLDKQIMESRIHELSLELKLLTKRKKRDDVGKPRPNYKSTLPLRYRQYLNSANKRGIDFKLTVEEFELVCKGSCQYCGTNSKIGVDRIDSSDGYHMDNVQSLCGMCNLMKYTHSSEVFLQHIRKIYRHAVERI